MKYQTDNRDSRNPLLPEANPNLATQVEQIPAALVVFFRVGQMLQHERRFVAQSREAFEVGRVVHRSRAGTDDPSAQLVKNFVEQITGMADACSGHREKSFESYLRTRYKVSGALE